MKDLSVIIVNWNTKNLLRECLESLYKEIHDISLEIIVVDNFSSDGSVEMLRNYFPGIKIRSNPKNMGFAHANNQGILISEGKYVLLLNPDTILLNNSLSEMVKFMNENPEVGIAGCKLIHPDGSLQPSCYGFPTLLRLFSHASSINSIIINSHLTRKWFKFLTKILPRNFSHFNEHNTIRKVESVSGAFMIIRRDILNKTKLLDEKMFLYFEEVDLCFRVRNFGYKVVFNPHASVIHLGGQSSKQIQGKSLEYFYNSVFYFYKKHYSKHRLIFARIIVFIGISIRIVILPIMVMKKDSKLIALLFSYYRILKLTLKKL